MSGAQTLLASLPLLALVTYYDLRYLRIPDSLSIAGLMLFAAQLVTVPVSGIDGRLIAAAVTFLVLFGLFAARLIGGGDVKFLPVLVLFVPPQQLNLFFLALSLAVPISVLGLAVARAAVPHPAGGWACTVHSGKLPVGLAMTLAALATCGLQLL